LEFLRSRKTMPSMERMMDHIGVSHATIRGYLKLLEAELLIVKTNQRVRTIRVTELGRTFSIPTEPAPQIRVKTPKEPRRQRKSPWGEWQPKGGTTEGRIEAIGRREDERRALLGLGVR
jgi:DNA-binding transcriptional MocR family regulator